MSINTTHRTNDTGSIHRKSTQINKHNHENEIEKQQAVKGNSCEIGERKFLVLSKCKFGINIKTKACFQNNKYKMWL